MGQNQAECIIARDDEGFTYNARVSRLTPIQEHRMIVKAVNHGVPPERVLEREFKSVEKDYGQNVLHLTLASAYVRKLRNHPAVAAFLSGQFPDIFAEFDAIAKAQAL